MDIRGFGEVFQDLDYDGAVQVIEKLDEVMGDLETLCWGGEEGGDVQELEG